MNTSTFFIGLGLAGFFGSYRFRGWMSHAAFAIGVFGLCYGSSAIL